MTVRDDEGHILIPGFYDDVTPVSPAEKAALELYLTQVPGAVRASFRRAEDPSGRSVPDQFSLHDGNDLARRYARGFSPIIAFADRDRAR